MWEDKGLARRNDSEKVLNDKTFPIAKNPGIEYYKRAIALVVYKLFAKTFADGAIKS